MEFNKINDEELNQKLLTMVRNERKLVSEILNSLKEVEDRKLFAKRGYPSLFAYCTEFLGYSESAAHRRISSMRLLKEVPDLNEKISSGALSLSNVAKAATFFRQERKLSNKLYSPQEKSKILDILQGKTQKQAEVELVRMSPKSFKNLDKERGITEEITELRLTLDKKTMNRLNRLKELKPGLSTQELLDWMLARCLKPIDPIEKKPKVIKTDRKPLPQRKSQAPQPLRKTLKRATRYEVWKKAGACCQFKDRQTGKSCLSRVGLEIDHIRPLSLGGDNRLQNLRLLCREHHQLLTRESFGAPLK